jgi:hypothetical protein
MPSWREMEAVPGAVLPLATEGVDQAALGSATSVGSRLLGSGFSGRYSDSLTRLSASAKSSLRKIAIFRVSMDYP